MSQLSNISKKFKPPNKKTTPKQIHQNSLPTNSSKSASSSGSSPVKQGTLHTIVSNGNPGRGTDVNNSSINESQQLDEEIWSQFRIHMFGYNLYNQLSDTISSPKIEIPISERYEQKHIIDIKMGRFHTLLLSVYGRVIALGKNSENQRGSTVNGGYIATNINPSNASEELFISKIECGGMHSVLIDENHRVYVLGDNTEGQCGFPSDVVTITGVRRVQLPVEEKSIKRQNVYSGVSSEQDDVHAPNDDIHEPAIIEAFCGESCTFLLTYDRKNLYAMGQNDCGQLGFSFEEFMNIYTPQRVEGLFDNCDDDKTFIVKVASGESHSLILRSDGIVLVSGSNDDGAMGGPSCTRFQPLTFFKQRQQKIIDICAGSRHSIFLTDEGVAWICGKNNYNQLGFHGKQHVQIPVRIMEDVHSVHAGSDFSLFRMRDSNGKTIVKTTGRNKDGELGGPSTDDIFNTITIDGIARVIACGGYHTMIITGPPFPNQPLYISYPRHLRIVENLKAKQNIQLLGMQNNASLKLEEYKEKQLTIQKEFEGKIQLLSIENKTKLDELHQKHHDEKYSLKLEYEEKIKNIKQEIQEATQALEGLKATHSEDMKENYKALILEKREKTESLRSDMIDKEREMSLELQKAIEEENKRHEAALERLQKQYDSMEHMLESRLSNQDRQTVTATFKKQYQVELKEKKRLLDVEYQKQLRKMQRKLDEEYRKNILWLVTMKKQFELSRMEVNPKNQNAVQHNSSSEIDVQTRYEERIKRLQNNQKAEILLIKKKAQMLLEQHGIKNDFFSNSDITVPSIENEDITPSKRFLIPKLLTSGTPKRSMTELPFHPSSPRLLPRTVVPDRLIGSFVKQTEYTKGEFVEKVHEGYIYKGKLDISLKIMRWSEKEKVNMEKQVYRLMQLQHPYIRKCYGLDIAEDHAIVLCEQCDTNIMTPVNKGEFSLRERISFCIQVLEGSAYLFESRMHANLKPDNIFVGNDNCVRIDMIGTAYQQPEIKNIVYSFGFLLYQMTTLLTIMTTDPDTNEVTIPDSCPEDIAGIILACMHPEEYERPTDLRTILDVLAKARDNLPDDGDFEVKTEIIENAST